MAQNENTTTRHELSLVTARSREEEEEEEAAEQRINHGVRGTRTTRQEEK